ncbi:hypothetical protein TgHK011_001665 [Trichoderma gracile]|nr:hypothetical protein TgHK011_001665 [Trichoderma gracile]
MGQLFSSVKEPSLTGPLSKLPPEILLLIASQLSSSPESLLALALTCKTLFSILDTEHLREKCPPGFLALLERDVADRFFFCSACRQLHPFSQDWNPTDAIQLYGPKITGACLGFHGRQVYEPNPGRSSYRLRYVHVRLVMNGHLYGSPAGLPLNNLDHSALVQSSYSHRGPLWQQISRAKIIGGELFLSTTHVIAGRAKILRQVIDEGFYNLCNHVIASPAWCMYTSPQDSIDLDTCRVAALEEHTPDCVYMGDTSLSLFKYCRDVPGSCDVCLTDYTTTIALGLVREIHRSGSALGETTIRPPVDGWIVRIVTYHQIGRGRDEHDWKWVALTKRPTERNDAQSNTGREPPVRDQRLYPPGMIRRVWQTERLELDEEAQ